MDSYYNYSYNYDYYSDNQPIWGFPSSASTFQTPAGAPPPAVAANSDDEASLLLASSCPKRRAGRRKFKETRHPVYRGIRRRNSNKWVCELRTTSNDKGKLQQCPSRIWLGTYPTAEMAARAHDVAALALRGRNACLNFADSASILRVPTSGDIKEIQRAAAEAGEMFNPSPHEWSTGENSRLETIEDEEGYSTSEEKYTTKTAAEESVEIVQESSSPTGIDYIDDAAMLARMSEGTLLSPQHHHHEYHGGGTNAPWAGFGWDDQMDCSDNYGGELSLWSWS